MSSISHRAVAVICGVLISILLFGVACVLNRRSFSSPMLRDLDPITKAYVDRAVNRALRDPVGRRDFALLADGAIIRPELTKVIAAKGTFDLPPDSRPEAALNDDMHIGKCWLIPGNAAQLGLCLSAMIHLTHVSIDHIPHEIAADVGRAPRSMLLWGGVDGEANEARLGDFIRSAKATSSHKTARTGPKATRGYTFALLGSFEYDIRASSHVQTFSLEPYFAESGMYFGVVVLEIVNNWGSNCTCLYRLRVHGDPYESAR